MKMPSFIVGGFLRWIDAVASVVHDVFEGLGSRPIVRFIENESGELLCQLDGAANSSDSPGNPVKIVEGRLDYAGSPTLAAILPESRVELMLWQERFLFRPLELPAKASEFLNGIVRSQIDRLTPWSAAEAAFGWSQPVVTGIDRLVITVASTALARIAPLLRAFSASGAHSIGVFASPPEGSGDPIKVWEEKTNKTLDLRGIRRRLLVVLAATGIAASTAFGAWVSVGASLDDQQSELARQIAAARHATAALQASAADSPAAVQRALEQRKHTVPSVVMVLESLSGILPDHTYVTELRIEGDKLRMVGVTQDAPALVGLIEQSGHFTQASFFAPTTRSASAAGENFHIQAAIRPGAPRS
jgi:general secretion pathway protein L